MRESSEVQTGIGPIRMVSGDSCLLPHPHSQLAYTCTQTRLYTCQYPHPNNFCPPPPPPTHTNTHAHLPRPTHRHPNFLSLSHTHTHTHNARTHTLYFYVACILGWSVITAFFLHIPTPCTHTHTHTHSLSLSHCVFMLHIL